MSFSEVPHDYSLEALGEYAQELINKKTALVGSSRTSVCVEVAVGGCHREGPLAAHSGASVKTLAGRFT